MAEQASTKVEPLLTHHTRGVDIINYPIFVFTIFEKVLFLSIISTTNLQYQQSVHPHIDTRRGVFLQLPFWDKRL